MQLDSQEYHITWLGAMIALILQSIALIIKCGLFTGAGFIAAAMFLARDGFSAIMRIFDINYLSF